MRMLEVFDLTSWPTRTDYHLAYSQHLTVQNRRVSSSCWHCGLYKLLTEYLRLHDVFFTWKCYWNNTLITILIIAMVNNLRPDLGVPNNQCPLQLASDLLSWLFSEWFISRFTAFGRPWTNKRTVSDSALLRHCTIYAATAHHLLLYGWNLLSLQLW